MMKRFVALWLIHCQGHALSGRGLWADTADRGHHQFRTPSVLSCPALQCCRQCLSCVEKRGRNGKKGLPRNAIAKAVSLAMPPSSRCLPFCNIIAKAAPLSQCRLPRSAPPSSKDTHNAHNTIDLDASYHEMLASL